jgi:hypothetical protein
MRFLKMKNKKQIMVYGLFGLLLGLILGVVLTTTLNTTGDAIKITAQGNSAPLPADIINVNAQYQDCVAGDKAYFTFDWMPKGEDQRYKVYLKDASANLMELKVTSSDNVGFPGAYLDPKMNKDVRGYVILEGYDNKCGDSYYLYIDSIKNNQIVTSKGYKFTWAN